MTRCALAKMAAVWILAFLLYGPAILLWEKVTGESHVPEDECFAEFFYTWYFLLCASTLEFFFPFLSVTFFNLSIYRSIRERRLRHRQETGSPQFQGSTMSTKRERLRLASYIYRSSFILKKKKPSENGDKSSELCSSSLSTGRNENLSVRSTQCMRLIQDKKIAKSLAVIVCVFALCWAPYTLLMIIRAACRGQCVSHLWYEMTFWLLWLNSAINPFLYPLCHSSFRRAFAKILCPKQRSTQASADHPSNTPR